MKNDEKQKTFLAEYVRLYQVGKNNLKSNNYSNTITIFEECHNLANNLKDKYKQIESLDGLTYCQYNLDLFRECICSCNDCLKLFKEENNKSQNPISNNEYDEFTYIKIKTKILSRLFLSNMIVNNLENSKSNINEIFEIIKSDSIHIENKIILLKKLVKSIYPKECIKYCTNLDKKFSCKYNKFFDDIQIILNDVKFNKKSTIDSSIKMLINSLFQESLSGLKKYLSEKYNNYRYNNNQYRLQSKSGSNFHQNSILNSSDNSLMKLINILEKNEESYIKKSIDKIKLTVESLLRINKLYTELKSQNLEKIIMEWHERTTNLNNILIKNFSNLYSNLFKNYEEDDEKYKITESTHRGKTISSSNKNPIPERLLLQPIGKNNLKSDTSIKIEKDVTFNTEKNSEIKSKLINSMSVTNILSHSNDRVNSAKFNINSNVSKNKTLQNNIFLKEVKSEMNNNNKETVTTNQEFDNGKIDNKNPKSSKYYIFIFRLNIFKNKILITKEKYLLSNNSYSTQLTKLINVKSTSISPTKIINKEMDANITINNKSVNNINTHKNFFKNNIINYTNPSSSYEDTIIGQENKSKIIKRIIEEMEKGINTEWYYDSKAPNCVSEYSYITKNGRQSNKTEKINQDSLFTYENFMMIKNFYFFGVCDGHGVNGHFASKHAKQYIAANLQFLEIEKSVSQEYKEKFENIIKDFEEFIPEKSSSFNNSTIKFIYEKLRLGLHNFSFCKRSSKDIKFNIKNVFFKTHEDIKNTSFISDHSGTTVCSVFILGKNLYCANLGDSRAVIACLEEGKFITYNLSIDHKPDNEEEKKRIISCNGRVEPSRNSFDVFVGPARVWQKNYDTPGLAMSRSIGDCAATKLGVISEPDIFDYTLRKTDKFIIIASDGIWEFITSQKAVEIVIPYFMKNNSAGACNELLSFATSLWKSHEASIDDITCIVIFLNVN